MRRLSAWAITHPVFPLVLFTVLTVFGIVAFIRLPITLNPDISAPFVQVTISEPGAAPAELETQILQKVEGAVANIGNVKNITSTATEGTAQTLIEFQIRTPVDRATTDVRDAIARVRADLPRGILEPQVQRLDVDGGPIVYFAISTTGMTEQQLSWFVDDTISKRLLAIAGVAQVSRSGGVSREIRVDLDPARMGSYGITAGEVNEQLRLVNVDAAGGRAQVGGSEQSIRVLGGAHSASQLGDVRLTMPDGRIARLSDIAEVRDGVEEIRSISRLNGRPATTFAVYKAKGASDVTTLHRVQDELAKISRDAPRVTLRQVFTTVDFTQQQYKSSIEALVEGAVLAVAIVMLFLRDWRATVIAALAIPLAALPTFAFMQWLGFTLNQMTLLALSLITGVLVDDAIVEVENITRHMKMGKSAYQAAMDAADEIGLAVVACSATIIAVFLPVSFLGGLVGQFFIQFGFTVAVAVFMSLLVARLISPLMAAYTLKPHEGLRSADGPLMNWYLGALRWSVEHRVKTLITGLAIFGLSVAGLALIPKTFTPDADFASSTLRIELPPGVLLSQTAATSARAYEILRRHAEVANVVEAVGENEDGEVRSGNLYIQLVPPSRRKLSQKQWEAQVIKELRTIPDARITFQSQSDGEGRDLTLYVVGSNPQLVDQTAREAVEQMRGLKELRDPRINGDMARPELQVRPNLDKAAQLGVTVSSISETVRLATLGDLPQNNAKFSLPDRQIPIRVSLIESARTNLATIENLPVRTSRGTTVPLKAVADIGFGQGPSKVRRYNQNRRVSLEADLNGSQLGTALDKIRALPVYQHLPAGVQIVEIGAAQYMQELFTSFVLAMIAGVMLVFAVLVLLFVRLFQPITILSALPLSIGGAVLGLVVTHSPFSLSTVLGILMLMGIVAKNSILLVDFAIEEMRGGKDRLTALLEAGHKRARPIVMTSVAMIAGMVPVALVSSASFQAQMAVAVIGGLVTSTGLTLVMVPAAFTWIDDLEQWVNRRIGHRWINAPAGSVGAPGATALAIAAILVLGPVLLSGCAVGPNHVAPAAPRTAGFTPDAQPTDTVTTAVRGGESQHFAVGTDLPGEWWALFGSRELDALISRAIRQYPDMAAQQAALRAARENVRAGQGVFAPQVQGTFNQQRAKISGASISPGFPGFITSLYQANVDVSYTFDLFGGERRTLEGLRAQADNQRYQLEASVLTLTSNVATSAIALAAAREQIEVTHQIIAVEEQQLRMIQRQYESGVRTRADVLQQQSNLATVRATLPALQQQLAGNEHALAALTGQFPHDAARIALKLSDLQLPETIPVSVPSALVAQRPDILAQAASVHRASADVGVATANLLPQLTLTGATGGESLSFGNLLQASSGVWSVAGNLTQPIFAGGSLRAKRRAAIDLYDQANAQYRLVVLNAFQNVADTLTALDNDAEALKAQNDAVADANASLQLIQRQYEAGAVPYVALLTAQQSYQQARIAYVRALASRFTDTVALFQALGGGWWNRIDLAAAAAG